MKAIVATLATLMVAGCTSDKEPVPKEKSAPAAVQPVVGEENKVDPQPNEPIAPAAKPKNPLEAKLTAENYLRIKEGMPRDDVLLILGQPTESNYELMDKQIREGVGDLARDRGLVNVREKWILKEKNVSVEFKWEKNPGSLLGAWKVVRKSHFGLQ